MKYEITKEQLQELAKWKHGKRLTQEWFPEAFETKLEIGKWYKDKSNDLFFITEFKGNSLNGYGWIGDRFSNSGCIRNSYWTNNGENVPATESEVFEALKKEAVKRGFDIGTIVKQPKDKGFGGGEYTDRNILKSNSFKLDGNELRVVRGSESGYAYVIFKDGKWAEIIKEKTLSKSEAEAIINEFKKDGYAYKIG